MAGPILSQKPKSSLTFPSQMAILRNSWLIALFMSFKALPRIGTYLFSCLPSRNVHTMRADKLSRSKLSPECLTQPRMLKGTFKIFVE